MRPAYQRETPIFRHKSHQLGTWRKLNFVARVIPDGDVLPIRTVYDGISHNIGNNYLNANPVHPEAVYMAGPDLVAG